MAQLVVTAVGLDRPGLVDELTSRLLNAGANVADSRMVNLRGQFALLLLAEIADDAQSSLSETMTEAGNQMGLSIHVAPQAVSTTPRMQGVPYHLRTYAMDQPGIVYRITHLLHGHNINIEELQTHLEPGSYSGTPLFTVDLRMTVPHDVPVKTLRHELENLCDSLNCDVELNPG